MVFQVITTAPPVYKQLYSTTTGRVMLVEEEKGSVACGVDTDIQNAIEIHL